MAPFLGTEDQNGAVTSSALLPEGLFTPDEGQVASCSLSTTLRPCGWLQGRVVMSHCPHGCDLGPLLRNQCFGSVCKELGDCVVLFSLEEALYLLSEHNAIDIYTSEDMSIRLSSNDLFVAASKAANRFPQRYAAYRHFRLKNWIVRLDALKFGSDFLLYAGQVDEVHSRYEVLIIEPGLRWRDLQASTRVAQAVNKDLLIAVVGMSSGRAENSSATASVSSNCGNAAGRSGCASNIRCPSLSEFLESPASHISEAVVRRWHPHVGDGPSGKVVLPRVDCS